MRHEQHLLSEDESAALIADVNGWIRRTGTNYNKLVTAARVNASTRYCVMMRGRRLTADTADRLRTAMRANPQGISKGEHKTRVRLSASEHVERQRAKRRRDFPAIPSAVDRTPCNTCGARGDVGCEHTTRF